LTPFAYTTFIGAVALHSQSPDTCEPSFRRGQVLARCFYRHRSILSPTCLISPTPGSPISCTHFQYFRFSHGVAIPLETHVLCGKRRIYLVLVTKNCSTPLVCKRASTQNSGYIHISHCHFAAELVMSSIKGSAHLLCHPSHNGRHSPYHSAHRSRCPPSLVSQHSAS
jgi:hypothetical protein